MCWAPLKTLQEGLQSEQLQHRQMRLELPEKNANGETATHLGIPIRYQNEPGKVDPALPALGEHSIEVLLDAGISRNKIDELLASDALLQSS